MRASVEDIHGMGAFAARVYAAVPALRSAHPQAEATVDRIAAAADDLHRRGKRPLTFAFVGDFSAGKSLLLGVLLGRPSLLPTSEVPTTGNITAIRLRPAPPTGARPDRIRVELLDRAGVGELVAHLLKGIVELVGKGGLDYPVGDLAGVTPTTDPKGWAQIDDVARAVWTRTGANAKLKASLAELVRIRDAWHRGQAMLPERLGQGADLPRAELEAAVKIGDSRAVPATFPETVSEFPFAAGTAVTAEVLAVLQPLVHRIAYEIDVPPGDWPFGSLLDQPGVELLDLPGLNSAGGRRDAWLAERELRHVTGILVALKGEEPETDSVLELPGFLERARVSRELLANSQIVVGQKFDRLPSAADSELFRSLHRMTTLLSGNRPEQVRYTSAAAGMLAYGLGRPPATREALEGSRAFWGGVAQAQPERPDAAALRDYAADGGIAGLRATIVRHVLEYGVLVHVTEMRAVETRIRSDLDALRKAAAPTAGAGDAEARLERFGEALDAAAEALRTRIGELRHMERLCTRAGESVLVKLRESAVGGLGVYGWDEWPRLAGQVRGGAVERQRVLGTTPHGGADLVDDDLFGDDPDDDGDNPVPTTADSLRGPYRDTAVRANDEVEALFREGVGAWTDGVGVAVEPLRALLRDDPSVLDLVAGVTEGDPARGDKRARRLANLATLRFVDAEVERVLGTVVGTEPDGAFPLTAGRAFWWDAAAPPPVSDQEDGLRRSHAVVLRARSTLAESISARQAERLGALLLELAARFGHVAALIRRDIPGGRERQVVRRAASRPAAPTDGLIDGLLGDGPRAGAGPDTSGWNGWANE